MLKNRKSIVLVLFAIFLFVGEVFALDVQLATPNAGPTGTFNLFGSRPLKARQLNFGIFTNYAREPLEFKNFSTGNATRPIVNYIITNDFVIETGLHKRFTMGIDVPVQGVRHVILTNLDTHGSYFTLGDISFYGKFAILHQDDFPVGLSIMPFVTAPTGSLDHFTGDRSADLGGRVIFDKEFSRGYIGMNVGYKAHLKKDLITMIGTTASLEVDDEFIYGIGGGVDILKDRLQVAAELRGSTTINDFAEHENSSPVELAGGFKVFCLDKRLAFNVGAGRGINGGYGAPNIRVFGGLTASIPVRGGKTRPTKDVSAQVKIETILLQGVHFFTDSAELTSDSKNVLDENAAELVRYPNVKFVVIGHTDSRGGDTYNQRLSERRAKSVADYFILKGIPTDYMSFEGHGEKDQIVPNDTPEHMERNRRVELQMIHTGNQAKQ